MFSRRLWTESELCDQFDLVWSDDEDVEDVGAHTLCLYRGGVAGTVAEIRQVGSPGGGGAVALGWGRVGHRRARHGPQR